MRADDLRAVGRGADDVGARPLRPSRRARSRNWHRLSDGGARAACAAEFTTIERFRTLSKAAEARFQALGIRNVSTIVGDGLLGWRRQAPFDRILVGAACANPPVKLITQLSDSGILIAPIGAGEGVQRLTLFQRIGPEVDTRDLGAVRFSPIVAGPTRSL